LDSPYWGLDRILTREVLLGRPGKSKHKNEKGNSLKNGSCFKNPRATEVGKSDDWEASTAHPGDFSGEYALTKIAEGQGDQKRG